MGPTALRVMVADDIYTSRREMIRFPFGGEPWKDKWFMHSRISSNGGQSFLFDSPSPPPNYTVSGQRGLKAHALTAYLCASYYWIARMLAIHRVISENLGSSFRLSIFRHFLLASPLYEI